MNQNNAAAEQAIVTSSNQQLKWLQNIVQGLI